MEIRELQQLIREAISSTVLESGVNISAVLSQVEIAQVATTVSHKLPLNPDMLIRRVYDTLFAETPNGIFSEKVNTFRRSLLIQYIAGDISKENHILSLFYFLTHYKNIYSTDITKELSNLGDFFESYLITSPQQLEEEIKLNPIKGRTETVGENFIRYDEEGKLIPTKRTIENFSNFINNKKNGN